MSCARCCSRCSTSAPMARQRHAVLCALAVVSVGTSQVDEMTRWSRELADLDDDSPTGAGRLVAWLALHWSGDIDAGVELCLRAADDPRFSQDTRDLFVGIATTDRFSLTDSTEDAEPMAARALEVARRTDVSVQRTAALLGAAWALVSHDPDRSLSLTQEAIRELPRLPIYQRLDVDRKRITTHDPDRPGARRRPAHRSSRQRGNGFDLRRPDPGRLRHGAAAPTREPDRRSGVGDALGIADRTAPVDDEALPTRPAAPRSSSNPSRSTSSSTCCGAASSPPRPRQ